MSHDQNGKNTPDRIGADIKGDFSNDETTPPFERWLDRKLKTAYGAVLDEAIPQDLIDLLRAKLDRKSE